MRRRPGRCSRAGLVLLLLMLLSICVIQPGRADDSVRVFYAGLVGSVKTALELAKFELVTDAGRADVFVLNGQIPDANVIRSRLDQGAGLVLILGPGLRQEQVAALLGIPLKLRPRSDAVSLKTLEVRDPLISDIAWNGAPQVHERFDSQTPVSSVQPLITAYEDGGWVLWQARPHMLVFNAFLNGANPQIQEWTYFNYLIYHLVERAAGLTALSFADYPASPVPHAAERNLL